MTDAMPTGSAMVVEVVEEVVLDVIRWFRQRQADGANPPTDDEIKARVRSKIAAGNAEGETFEQEDPSK
jgi:hypothetical protein